MLLIGGLALFRKVLHRAAAPDPGQRAVPRLASPEEPAAAHPDEPWRWNEEWASGRVHRHLGVAATLFAVAASAAVALMVLFAAVVTRGDPPGLTGLVVIASRRSTTEWRESMTEPGSRSAVRPKTPVHLWIVGVLAILWHLMAVFDYLATQLKWESYMSQFTQEQLDYFYGFPSWMVAAWAIAVWSGFLGSIALVLRKSWAVWLFGLALLGLAISTLYNFVLSDGATIMGSGAVWFTVVIWIVAIALLLYARRQAANGVLR